MNSGDIYFQMGQFVTVLVRVWQHCCPTLPLSLVKPHANRLSLPGTGLAVVSGMNGRNEGGSMKGWRLKPRKCGCCGKRCMWSLCPACRKLTKEELAEAIKMKTQAVKA